MNNQIFNLTMPGKVRRAVLVAALFLATVNITLAQGLAPAILVQPGTNLEVGEEVFFSATGTTYTINPTLLRKARYEWDFGDGYAFRFGFPYYYTACSGLACVHYFMKPGTFTVKLIVSVYDLFEGEGTPAGAPVAKDSVTVLVTVTGESPMIGFELQHAHFHARLAQYLYAQIPVSCQGNSTTLRVSLKGPGESTTILFSKSGLASEEKFLLDQKPLAQGDYIVVAELLDAGNQRLPGGIWRDKFSKKYSGMPKVGFDENNSFRINGELFFPIGPYMTNQEGFQKFIDSAGINMLHTEGWYPAHNPSTWTDYLTKASAKGLMAIGPHRGDYFVNEDPNRWQFNHDPDRIAQYVQLTKDQPAMLAWSWQDEPNLGGWPQKAYAPVLAAWGYVCHREDPHHPAFNLFYGYGYTEYYGTVPDILYDYPASAPFFGGKKWVQDAIAFDIYPINYRLHPSLNFSDMGPYSAYLDALDRIQTNNKNLVPCMPTLQPCEETAGDNTPPITTEQVYLEAWMNVIHGAKGIIWFAFFDYSSIRWTAMKKFADQMKVLAPVVLGQKTERTLSDDANVPLKRVDAMIRENDSVIYVFTARVTEPDPIPAASYQGIEPGSITVNFMVSGLSGSTVAEVVDESRTVSITNGQFTDTFDKNAVHIYRINTPTSISDKRHNQIPSRVVLGQNYPNPFNPSTAISFGLPSQSFVSLKVFDALGREVATIISEELPAGYYSRRWNIMNMASGVYFYRLQARQTSGRQAGIFTETKKLVLLR